VSSLIPFEFNGQKVRVVVDETTDQEYFVAKDVALLLGYKNTTKAVRDHCKKPITVGGNDSFSLNAKGGNESFPLDLDPQTRLIPESDLWRLIIKSTLPEAEKIEEWVMEEVLPQIRKTGSFSVHQEKPQDPDLSTLMMKMLENQSRQTDALLDLTGSVIKMMEYSVRTDNQTPMETIIEYDPKISRDEKMNIRASIESKSKELADELGLTKKSITPGMWVEFKNYFDVSDYGDLCKFQYGPALNWIMMYEPRKKPILDEIKW